MVNIELISTISHHFRIALDILKVTTHLDCGFWFFPFLFNLSNTFRSFCLCQTTVHTHHHLLEFLEQSLEMDSSKISFIYKVREAPWGGGFSRPSGYII